MPTSNIYQSQMFMSNRIVVNVWYGKIVDIDVWFRRLVIMSMSNDKVEQKHQTSILDVK